MLCRGINIVIKRKETFYYGSVREIAREILGQNGFRVELYEPLADDLHGSGRLPSDRLTLYMANFEQASNQTVVRIQWCPKHALDIPRFVNEEVSVFVSLANPYGLQDVPRVRTYINAYTATRTTIQLTIDKLMGNLFACPYESKAEITEALCRFNRMLSRKGLRVLPLRFSGKKALIYLYRPKRLSADLRHRQAEEILHPLGYDCTKCEQCLAQLSCTIAVKDGRYSIDNQLAAAIVI